MNGGGQSVDGPGSIRRGSKRPPDDSQDSAKPGNHQPKRSRVTRACDQCRATRERCDGVKPTCGTCDSQSRPCSWEEKPKKRGIQPNYIRTLELTLAWLFRNVSNAESNLSISLPATDGSAFRLIGAKDATSSESLHQAWRNSIVAHQIDQLLSGTTIEQGPPTTSFQPASHNRMTSLESARESRTPSTSLEADGNAFASISHGGGQVKPPIATPTPILLPENAWTLLEYYFAFTHSWLPFVGKHEILKLMYTYPAEGLSLGTSISAEYAELWMILALADVQMQQMNSKYESTFVSTAKSMVPADPASLTLEHVNCFLLSAVLELTRGSSLGAWLSLGSALRLLAFPHGMNKASTSPIWSRLKRSRLAAFVLETALACRLQAVPEGAIDQLNANSLIEEDGDEEWAPWRDPLDQTAISLAKAPARSCSTFNRFCRMAVQAKNATTGGLPDTGFADLVYLLIANATKTSGRTQPSLLASRHPTYQLHQVSTSYTRGLPVQQPLSSNGGARSTTQDSAIMFSSDKPTQPNHHASISMPNDLSPDFQMSAFDTAQSRQAIVADAEATSLASDATLKPPNDVQEPPSDLFEELATFDASDMANQDQQFMHNLGFGPELDLAEFFGADYQPSDPLLAYMQPTLFGTSSTGKTAAGMG